MMRVFSHSFYQILRRAHGFTLFESLIVISIIVILSAIVLPNFLANRNRAGLDSATREIVASLREAQSRAAAGENGNVWGIHFENSTVTSPFFVLFQQSYNTSNTIGGYQHFPQGVYYATTSLDSGRSLDIIFNKISGTPLTTSTITLNLTSGSASSTVVTSTSIIVDTTGLINF